MAPEHSWPAAPDGCEAAALLAASSKPPTAKPPTVWHDTGPVFTIGSGRLVEPRNLVRSFRRICDHNLRVIKLDHQHTTTFVPRSCTCRLVDPQMVVGHAHISTTMQIYTHLDEEARNNAPAGSTCCSAPVNDL
jgi:integrase